MTTVALNASIVTRIETQTVTSHSRTPGVQSPSPVSTYAPPCAAGTRLCRLMLPCTCGPDSLSAWSMSIDAMPIVDAGHDTTHSRRSSAGRLLIAGHCGEASAVNRARGHNASCAGERPSTTGYSRGRGRPTGLRPLIRFAGRSATSYIPREYQWRGGLTGERC
jgi:hypothetical protein